MYRMIVIPLISFCYMFFFCFHVMSMMKKKIKRLVEEWTYKEIDFPSVPIFTKFAREIQLWGIMKEIVTTKY